MTAPPPWDCRSGRRDVRSARVLLDIGLHLRLPMRSGDRDLSTPDALELLRNRCHQGAVCVRRTRALPGPARAGAGLQGG
ncbi:hypothetical protein FXF52_28725 [Micromonospora sp. MP36]|nr:hypothetical protein FXF52_28725 [Micromonospora sp. MP36]